MTEPPALHCPDVGSTCSPRRHGRPGGVSTLPFTGPQSWWQADGEGVCVAGAASEATANAAARTMLKRWSPHLLMTQPD